MQKDEVIIQGFTVQGFTVQLRLTVAALGVVDPDPCCIPTGLSLKPNSSLAHKS